MKKLIELAVTRPIGVSIIFFALCVLGFISLRNLAVDLMPEVEPPWMSITTRYDGVGPQEVETLVTRPLEQSLARMEGVNLMSARSAQNISYVFLRFDWDTNPQVALEEVRMAIDRVRVKLPAGAEAPNIYRYQLGSSSIMYLGLEGTDDLRRLKYIAEERLAPRLERIPGVAAVETSGGRDREIQVRVDVTRLIALGVQIQDVTAALRRENLNVSAGLVRDAGRETLVRIEGELRSLEDIERVVVKNGEGQPIFVRDVATVADSILEVRGELWLDGKPGITLKIQKQDGSNTVEVAKRLRDEISSINRQLEGVSHLNILHDSSRYIESAVTGVQKSALWGAGLAILVLLFFLRSFRATLVIAVAIPLSVLSTFILMNARGMSLNLISFGGLALGIGLMVDSAVVVLESVYSKREDGLSAKSSALEGATEISGAVIAGTLTTVAVFVPVVFLGELTKIVLWELAAVVSFSLCCALLVALTLVPMLANTLLARPARSTTRLDRGISRLLNRWEERFERLLRNALTAPWAIVTGSVVLLGSSIVLFDGVDSELIPESDEAQLSAGFELPVGTPLEKTIEIANETEARILSVLRPGELLHRVKNAGPQAWWSMAGVNTGNVDLVLVPAPLRKRSLDQILGEIQKTLRDIPGARFSVRPRKTNPLARVFSTGQDRIEVHLRGDDLDVAERFGNEVEKAMLEVPGIQTVSADRDLGRLERVIVVNRPRAAELGLGSSDIAEAVENSLVGSIATLYRQDGDEFDLRVVLESGQRETLAQLEELPIHTPSGRQVPLHALATVIPRIGPSSIGRINQERVLRLNAWPTGRPLSEIVSDLEARLGELTQPEGFSIRVEGESASQNDTFQTMKGAILLSLFLVFAVMAVQFESLKQPLVIMASVPFGLSGVALALLLTKTTLNLYSFLGIIVLIGMVVNNAIVLVDSANRFRLEQQASAKEAMILASRRRLRPILMTTLTTLLGLVPLALGWTEGGEMQAPLARAILGGLTTSTLVTLVLVPAVYSIVERPRGAEPLASGQTRAPQLAKRPR